MSENRDNNNNKNSMDDVIDVYKKDVDRTLLRENLKLTVEERLRKMDDFNAAVEEIRKAGQASRKHTNGS